jgi:hypothetical protein
MLAVVALAEQRVTIYDTEGNRILQAPVSTGTTGLETPVGIYSVVQKEVEHHSNIYEDGAMPFMQRITWTGIALHGGVLPGHPASHGCVRMPVAFAEHLYALTDIGLRVIIVRDDIHPSAIDHALLLNPQAGAFEAAKPQTAVAARGRDVPMADASPAARQLQSLQALAAARSQEATAANKNAAEAKTSAARRAAEAAPAAKALRSAETNATRLEEALHRAERALDTASPQALTQATQGKEKALAALAQAQRELEAAKLQNQAKADAEAQASQEAASAEAAKSAALDAAEEAALMTSPVSVFISRKTQRLYVRRRYQPIFEGPVSIRDPDKPIGTYVFTALTDRGGDVRWSVVSMYRNTEQARAAPQAHLAAARSGDAAPADVNGARTALDRIGIGQDMRERIWQVVLPGSSLIVSDEGANVETGKDTDFIVLMSGEPQGGLKSRHREFMARPRGDGFFGGPTWGFGLF